MTVMNHQIIDTVLTPYDVIRELKDFAVANGWTNIRYEENKTWQSIGGGNFDFVGGGDNEYFLALESTGNGSQTLHFRLRMEADGTDPLQEWLQIGSQDAANKVIDGTSGTHPTQQNNWNTFRFTSMPTAGFIKTWFFADGVNFLMVVGQVNNSYCIGIAIGSLEPEDPAEDELMFCGYARPSTGTSDKWYNGLQLMPYANRDHCVYYDGIGKGQEDYRLDLIFTISDSSTVADFFNYTHIIHPNNFARLTPGQKPNAIIEFISDGKWHYCGEHPIFVTDVSGKAIGEKVKIGSDEYYVFPNCDITRKKGIAIRVL